MFPEEESGFWAKLFRMAKKVPEKPKTPMEKALTGLTEFTEVHQMFDQVDGAAFDGDAGEAFAYYVVFEQKAINIKSSFVMDKV